MDSRFFLIGLILLVLVSGCTEPQTPADDDPDVTPPQNGDDSDDFEEPPIVEPPIVEPPVTPPTNPPTRPPSSSRLQSPISCNDPIILDEVESSLGSSYIVTRGVPAFGRTFNSANCFVKKNNVSIITFSILEHQSNSIAIDVVEDEKNQNIEQLFAYEVEDSPIGSIGYLIEQPTADGALFRLLFVDDTANKVSVFIKSNTTDTPRSVVEKLGRALEKVI